MENGYLHRIIYLQNKLRIIVDYRQTINGYDIQNHRVKLLYTKYIYDKTIYQKKYYILIEQIMYNCELQKMDNWIIVDYRKRDQMIICTMKKTIIILYIHETNYK